ETRLVYGETLGNPALEVLDVPAVAAIAHDAGLTLMIDNTFATPYLFRPLDHGADIVMHSATKFMGGHGIAVGGVLVDGGTFDWEDSGKFPTLTEPYPSYHGLEFADEFGTQAFLMRARVEGLRDFGATMAPQTAFYLIQGLETLPVRMARHVENARKIVAFLAEAPEVAWVVYPELEGHPDHDLAKQLLPKGCGAIFPFGIVGGRNAGRRFIERLSVFSHLANVGDAKSLVIHPASTTHATMSSEELAAAGVGEDLVRLSIGLEDPDDLISDLAQALRASQRG
ncbi:MAG: PLP-dependent transferase, partial [Actinomycetia bacterium]|nr:PLP-dependent transferase [Actinomycetes bacterium]